jgi:hypothetical protein
MLFVAMAVLSASASAVAAGPGDGMLHDPEYGFSVAVPAWPKPTDPAASATPVTFGGPARDGRAPSCDVQIQHMGWTLSDFRAQTLEQFKSLGITVDSESRRRVSNRDALMLVSSGHDLKILSLAVQVDQAIYLVSCIAPVDQFPVYEAAFRRVIDSFALN